MSYSDYDILFKLCPVVARELFNFLKDSEILAKNGVIFKEPPKSSAFRLEFSNSSLTGVSICVPGDAWGNQIRNLPLGKMPSTYETALISANGNLAYNSEAGYEDVCRFSSVEELVEELVRLANYGSVADS